MNNWDDRERNIDDNKGTFHKPSKKLVEKIVRDVNAIALDQEYQDYFARQRERMNVINLMKELDEKYHPTPESDTLDVRAYQQALKGFMKTILEIWEEDVLSERVIESLEKKGYIDWHYVRLGE